MDVKVIEIEERKVYGLGRHSSDSTQSRHIPELSRKYHAAVNKADGGVLPFYVVSRNYDERTHCFELFIGGGLENENTELLILPQGLYARAMVRPVAGLLWGLAIGRAKQSFYTKWLPSSGYKALNMEYEYHTEASKGKRPQIELLFAVTK